MSQKKNEIDCTVHKSLKKDETYIFIPESSSLADLPVELMSILGKTEEIMRLVLTPDKKMARGKANEIIKSINKQGFHLQMPVKPHLNKNPLPTFNERFLDKDL